MEKAHYLIHLVRIPYTQKYRYLRYYIHKLLWDAFNDKKSKDQPIPFLYRILKADQRGYIHCLVQSSIQPIWSNIDDHKLEVLETKMADFIVKRDDRFYFRLEASPIFNKSQGGIVRGKKIPMLKNNLTIAWLHKKADNGGFEIHELVSNSQLIKVRKDTAIGALDIKLSNCNFDGYLTVNDPVKFVTMLKNGIGPKKSFGFGLLTIGKDN